MGFCSHTEPGHPAAPADAEPRRFSFAVVARAGEERVEEEGAAWGAAAMISPRTPAPCPAIGQLHTMSKRVRVRLHIRLRKACMPNLSESRLTGAPPYRPEPYRRASFEKGRTYARLRSSHQLPKALGHDPRFRRERSIFTFAPEKWTCLCSLWWGFGVWWVHNTCILSGVCSTIHCYL